MTDALTLPPDLIDRTIANDPYLHSDHSRRQYRANLRKFEAWRDGRPLTKLLVESYAVELQERYAPATVKQKLSAVLWWVRKFVDIAHEIAPPERAELVAKQAARVLSIQVSKIVKGSSPQVGRHVKGSELVKLVKTCLADPSPAGARDAALFAVAWTTGLRRSEFLGLHLDDLTPMEETLEDGSISHYGELKVQGKGDKARPAYLVNGAYQALRDWLKVRGEDPGFIFCPVRKGGVPSPSYHMSGEALRKIAEKRIAQAGIKHLTWHDFRRTFAGNLLDTNDLATVQALLGHANPTTTARYDRRPERRKREAVRGLTMPTIGV